MLCLLESLSLVLAEYKSLCMRSVRVENFACARSNIPRPDADLADDCAHYSPHDAQRQQHQGASTQRTELNVQLNMAVSRTTPH